MWIRSRDRVDVVVEHEYEALHDDELTLRPGDVIRNVRKIEEEGWMEGTLNGRRGLFPDNFVKEIKKDTLDGPKEESVVKRDRSSGNVASLVQRMSTYGIPAGGFQPHSHPRTFPKKAKKRQCKVLFEYTPQNEDELELKVGEIIDITEEVEEGWWSGTLHGKFGLFPSNFVKELELSDDEGTSDVTDETGYGSVMEQVLTSAIIMAFSDTIAKESSTTGPTTPTSPGTGNGIVTQPKKPLPSLPSAAKPTPLNMTDSVKADGESRAKVKEYCKVVFPFEATNDDELNLKEGDIIHILGKDTGEPGWWRGEVNGKEGVFPDNFVTLISDSEKEKPKKPPPPSKSSASKPEVPGADKKPAQPKPEDKGDKPLLDHRPSTKPAAPLVPPKKPLVPPGKGPSPPLKPGSIPPKRPEKPQATSLSSRSNGEIPTPRPKSDFEPTLPSKPKTLSGDWGEKAAETDFMSFDDFLSTSEKLSHPTASRPKMPGRRLPGQFAVGFSPSRDVSVEKPCKVEDEEHLKPKLPPSNASSLLTHKPSLNSSAVPEPSSDPRPEPKLEPKPKSNTEDRHSEMEDLRAQMKELLLTVELLKTQQTREIADLRSDLNEEKSKRMTLQVNQWHFAAREGKKENLEAMQSR
ncbi:CD2-associated protein-like [Scleropages formosus]|uniref:Osteoclast-stimulating factor 1 n=1 Tax=Scleropages formosus TaxID=113540 RepID=A0A0P7V6V3_SCLFO|nr:CD2-associated protein-like [Scleropages formosus]